MKVKILFEDKIKVTGQRYYKIQSADRKKIQQLTKFSRTFNDENELKKYIKNHPDVEVFKKEIVKENKKV
jgi:hypothetical protein